MKIQCPQCNAVQPAPAQFCNNCGVQFTPQKSNPIFNILVVIGILALIIFCCLVLQGPRISPPPISTTTIAKRTARENFIATQKPELAKYGIEIALSGPENDVLNLKSNLSVYEMSMKLQNSLENFRNLGFRKIILEGKNNETKTLDLEVLDAR